MDFSFSTEQTEFRHEVRDFLETEIRRGTFQPAIDAWIHSSSPAFTRLVAQRGWIGMTWPEEYGGKGRTYVDRLVLTEELLRYGAPVACHWFSDRQIGPAILAHGSDQLKRELLPQIIQGEAYFALGMSEPEAGSDLASLRTRASQQGDEYVINGQKVWTSGAHFANYIYLVARTDPDAPKQKGISEFIVDMKLPGISVRPLVDMTGGHHYNEIFFDNVHVPARYLMGEKNRGFYQILSQLDYERSGMERLMSNYPLFEELVRDVKETRENGRPLSEDPLVRSRLSQLQIEFDVGRLLIYKVAWILDQGRIPNYEAAMAKTYATDFEQRLAHAAMQTLGPLGSLRPGSKYAPIAGKAAGALLSSPGYTLQGGTSEILRNIIALRGLGLPSA